MSGPFLGTKRPTSKAPKEALILFNIFNIFFSYLIPITSVNHETEKRIKKIKKNSLAKKK